MEEKVQYKCCSVCKQKKLLLQNKAISGAVVCSHLLFSVFAPVLLCIQQSVWLHLCVLECVFSPKCRDQISCLTVCYLGWFVLHSCLDIKHSANLGLYACVHVYASVFQSDGGQLTSEAVTW